MLGRFLLLVKLVASANSSVWEFQQLLGQHHIERHYNETDKAIGYRPNRSRLLATVTVICNATPLINFAAISRLDILQTTFDLGEVNLPLGSKEATGKQEQYYSPH